MSQRSLSLTSCGAVRSINREGRCSSATKSFRISNRVGLRNPRSNREGYVRYMPAHIGRPPAGRANKSRTRPRTVRLGQTVRLERPNGSNRTTTSSFDRSKDRTEASRKRQTQVKVEVRQYHRWIQPGNGEANERGKKRTRYSNAHRDSLVMFDRNPRRQNEADNRNQPADDGRRAAHGEKRRGKAVAESVRIVCSQSEVR